MDELERAITAQHNATVARNELATALGINSAFFSGRISDKRGVTWRAEAGRHQFDVPYTVFFGGSMESIDADQIIRRRGLAFALGRSSSNTVYVFSEQLEIK